MPKITDQTVISATTLAGDTPVQYFVPVEKLNATTSKRISSTQLVEFVVGQMLGATGSAAGLMSSADKSKLDLITITSASSIDSLVSASHASATSGNAAISITGQAISVALDPAGGNLLSVQAGGLRAAAPTITISGAVSGSGTTAITTTLGSGSVSYANIQNVSTTSTLLGRYSAGAGTVQEISIGSGLTLTGSTLSASGSGATNLTFSRDATTLTVLSDTGTDAILPIATGSLAGLLGAADKTKLDAITGTNTGDQTITLTGNVTGSGTGSFATTIANSAVTLAMMANVATSTVFYRKTASTGVPEVQTLATLKTDLGLTGTNSGDQTITLTGNVTGSGTGSFATTIANSAVTLAMMADVATSTVFYRKTASTGVPEVQTLATLKTDLGLTGTNSGDQTITLTGNVTGSGTGSFAATIANDAVTFAKMQNSSGASVLIGRGSASGAGDFEEITLGTNLSMSGTTLNATGGSGSPAGSNTQIQYNNSGAFGASANLTFGSNVLTVTGTETIATGTITSSSPALAITQTWNSGGVTFKGLTMAITSTANATDSLFIECTDDATTNFSVSYLGSIKIGTGGAKVEGPSSNGIFFGSPSGSARLGNTSATAGSVSISDSGIIAKSDVPLGWVSGSDASASLDTAIYRQAANNVAIRNSTNAQRFDVFNTYTSSTSYETLKAVWSSNVCTITTEAGSTGGSIRALTIGSGDAVGNNQAGVNTIFQSGRGSGNATPGSIIWQTAPATSSGTGYGSYATRGEINPNGRWGFGSTSDSGTNFAFWADNTNLGASFMLTGAGANGTSNINNLKIRTSRGTIASPSAVQANDLLFRFSGLGYGSTAWSSSARAGIDMLVVSNWTDSAHETAITFSTTPASSTTMAERVRIASDGSVGIGTNAPSSLLDVNSDNIRLRTAKTPSSASDTGTTGMVCWDSSYVYVCTATNTWKRAAIATW